MVVALFVVLGVVAGRLVWLQTAKAAEFSIAAGKQRTQAVTLTPRRGAILDREGEPLAISVDARTVYATPRSIKDPRAVAAMLARYLGGDEATYLKRVTRNSGWVYVERKVPLEKAQPLQAALKAAKLSGIGFAEDSRRVYPCGDLACQVLGFVGIDDTGLAGVERQYNDILGGKAGHEIAERDAKGNPIPGGVTVDEDPVDGKDIVLTIDKEIQYQAQLQLAETVAKNGAKSGSVIVMDPRDGSILAMASTPTFDPNAYRDAKGDAKKNKAIADTYEPGSTVKALTAAAVIEQGLFTPRSMFHLPPTLKVADVTIHEAHPRGSVDWSLTQIVTQSSNVGAVKLGQALGPRRLSDYFARFGLLERTGVDFPLEAKGQMPAYGSWSHSTIANVPFGQGVSVTEIQLARALGAIANKGLLTTPHFLASVRDDPTIKFGWTTRRAISATTAATVTEVMRKVVADGTGKSAAVPGYDVAGKTGTAQKALAGVRGYAKGQYIASFAGFLPAEDPRVLIVVTIDEPHAGLIYGGSVAAPMFSALAGFAVGHLDIPPPSRSSDTTGTLLLPGAPDPQARPAKGPASPPAASGKGSLKGSAKSTTTKPTGGVNGAPTDDVSPGPP
jgi:cell division protein FtsI (penicillin-binding protein 3)